VGDAYDGVMSALTPAAYDLDLLGRV